MTQPTPEYQAAELELEQAREEHRLIVAKYAKAVEATSSGFIPLTPDAIAEINQAARRVKILEVQLEDIRRRDVGQA